VVLVAATLLVPLVGAAAGRIRVSPPLLAWGFGAVLIAGLGWLDDRRSLSAASRLGGHVAAAAALLACAGWWDLVTLPVVGAVSLAWLGLPLALLWIVGLTNAYNFMDGIDGLAGGQAVVAGLGWAWMGRAVDAPAVGAIGWTVALSSAAFLVHNWSPARIFLGDVGSGFLGYTFAALPFLASEAAGADARLRLPAAAALMVSPFVFDAVWTFGRRLARGENVFLAHRSHLYQRLVLSGWSHAAVSSGYLVLAAVGCGLAIGWLQRWQSVDEVIAAGLPALFAVVILLVRARERR
jgi:UDP-N-acetylmuramyl pentapeptide phosphotransferase/UDP-N-acetylglucosamine-1-phosphate transferase